MTISKDFRSEYCALINAINRCHNEDHAQFKDYGARGIVVCDEWRDLKNGGAQKFLDHIGAKPDKALTLDRIKNDEGYEHGNVRWASRHDQYHNRRKPKHTRLPHPRTADARELLAKGMSQADVVRALSMSKALVCLIANGKR